VLSSAVFQSEITSFVVDSSRSRKMILLNDVSGRFVFKNAVRLRRARRGDNVGFSLIQPAATLSPSLRATQGNCIHPPRPSRQAGVDLGH
jgi:hypothetical protein